MENYRFTTMEEILSDSIFLEEREYPSNLRPNLNDSELESQVSEDTKESKKKINEL